MRLAGPPGMQVRFTLNISRLNVTVGGIFPPERATLYRGIVQQEADRIAPDVQAEYDRGIRRCMDQLLYGNSYIPLPRGILSVGKERLADHLTE